MNRPLFCIPVLVDGAAKLLKQTNEPSYFVFTHFAVTHASQLLKLLSHMLSTTSQIPIHNHKLFNKNPSLSPSLSSFLTSTHFTHSQMLLRIATVSPAPSAPPPLKSSSFTRKPSAQLRPPTPPKPTSSISNFSISDQDLESRGFNLHRSFSHLNLDHLNTVFVAVGFPKRDPEKIRLALENTESLLWIEYEKTKRPVAFARATGDGVFNAIIWDVVVDPSFQGIGLGKAVMERLVEELLGKGISNIALYAEPRVVGFYRPLGFATDPGGIRGMVYSRKQNKRR